MSDIIIALDPGDTAGLAWWILEEGLDNTKLLGMDQVKHEDLAQWFVNIGREHNVKIIVVEKFVLFSKRAKQQAGSNMKAPQGVGVAKTAAKFLGAKVVEQHSSVLPGAIKIAGFRMPNNHADTHKWAAYAHGYLYLFENGYIRSALQKEMSKK